MKREPKQQTTAEVSRHLSVSILLDSGVFCNISFFSSVLFSFPRFFLLLFFSNTCSLVSWGIHPKPIESFSSSGFWNKDMDAGQTVEHLAAFGLPLCIGAQIAAYSTLWAASQISCPSSECWNGERDWRWRESEGKGELKEGEGVPFSERKSEERERRRGLRETEVGVVTARMTERACVCI